MTVVFGPTRRFMLALEPTAAIRLPTRYSLGLGNRAFERDHLSIDEHEISMIRSGGPNAGNNGGQRRERGCSDEERELSNHGKSG